MVRIGKVSNLEIVKFTEQGAYLDGGPYGEILLPKRYVTGEQTIGELIDVFVHFDSDDRIVATTVFPYAMVGEFAFLEVVDVTPIGAFLDWGLPKNLFVPYAGQKEKMAKGKRYIVSIYVDEKNGRIAATSKINKFLNKETTDLKPGDEVDLLISGQTEIGFSAIVNNAFSGILYFNEVFKSMKIGDKVKGYIKKVRDDGKIDLSLEKFGYRKVEPVLDEIIHKMKAGGGVLNLSDKSTSEDIKNELGISKKTFKKAIGALYRQKLIRINEDSIILTGNE
ncbi:MAG: GntR family transcriptional regulator [Prolixibacteraceae bacterium]|nr:GntR family transcriptional regulator [Prolixibacteraceae bacterium]